MGHCFSCHRHCHYDYNSHCHGTRQYGCDPCCCHHPVIVTKNRYLRRARRRFGIDIAYGTDMTFCQCGGYIRQPPPIPPMRLPPPIQINVPPQYSPIVPYPQVPYPQNGPTTNPYQAPQPMPNPNVQIPVPQLSSTQKPIQPRSPSPPPSYYDAIR